MIKHRVLQALESVPDDLGSMSVNDLKNKLKTEIDLQKSEQKKTEMEVCDKYKGKYIKKKDPQGIFGLNVDYIRIDEIKPGSMTTEWTRCYDISGERVNTYRGGAVIREMESGYAYDSMTQKELESCEFITEKEYKEAVNQCEKINKITKNLMK